MPHRNLKLGILFLVLLSISIYSCEGDQELRFVFTDLSVENTTSEMGMPHVNYGDSLSGNLYGIRMNLYPEETSRKGRYFDPFEAPAIGGNAFRYIFITSNKDFDEEHPAGTLLNECFYYFSGNFIYGDSLRDSSSVTITASFLPGFPENPFPDYADFLLCRYPTNNTERVFYVRLVKYDLTEFSDSTTSVKLY